MADDILSASGIYKITHLASGKVYVGSAVDLRNRRCGHFAELKKNRHRNAKLQHAFNKYGIDAFAFCVLELVPDKTLLLVTEQKWIDALDAVESGYNITRLAGSRLGSKWSEEAKAAKSAQMKGRSLSQEHRAKLSAAGKGRKVSAETRAKQSAARFGTKMPNISAALKGRKRSPEQIEKQRLAITGRKQPEHEKIKQRAALMGRKFSEETRRKISEANRGQKRSEATREKIRLAGMGKTHSLETRAKMSESHRKRNLAREIAARE